VLLPAAAWLCWRARGGPVPVGTAIYAASVVLLFATSSLYHCFHWEQPARGLLGRLDHAAIFLLISGSFTPFGLRIGGLLGGVSLAGLWLGAAAGIAAVVRPQGVGKRTRAAIYVGLGWAMVPLAPALLGLVGWHGVGLLVLGGLFYTVGAVIYALRRPDPFPRTFGFHEVFHLLVIAAAACHFAAVAGVAV
jgi:hemolysin III